MRCMDRKCGGRLHLTLSKDDQGAESKIATVSKECDMDYNNHSWIKKEKILKDIDNKIITKSDMDRRSFQMAYFEKELKDKPNS